MNDFQKDILQEISNFLPDHRGYDPEVSHAPKRKDVLTKEEKLICKDGYDGPNYWELFAQFYYSGISVPAYCRPYARPNHPFKTPGMLCLSENGVWEKQ